METQQKVIHKLSAPIVDRCDGDDFILHGYLNTSIIRGTIHLQQPVVSVDVKLIAEKCGDRKFRRHLSVRQKTSFLMSLFSPVRRIFLCSDFSERWQ